VGPSRERHRSPGARGDLAAAGDRSFWPSGRLHTVVRGSLATIATLISLLAFAVGGAAAQGPSPALSTLDAALANGMQSAGSASSAYVLDLGTGQSLFSAGADTARLPASVEKVYTTSTALLRFGPTATLSTAVLGRGSLDRHGGWHGTLFLRGGGDPTFGSASYDRYAYGTGATMQRLVSNLIKRTGIRAVYGRVVGDETYFDSLRGTAPTGFHVSYYLEGLLSALAYDRGLANEQGSAFQIRPALFAAQRLLDALRAAGVRVPRGTTVSSGVTPRNAVQLAAVHSPNIATLTALTNAPSDNFFAEMLLKGLGARFAASGTTAAGAAVVRSQLNHSFGIRPVVQDGSGLSRRDSTSPREVVTVLARMATNPAFTSSLAVAGETGTLQYEMQGTVAQGRCRGKTGTLHDVSNLVGYCHARDGHTLAFAFLMNSIDPNYAHPIQDQMAVALAKYNG